MLKDILFGVYLFFGIILLLAMLSTIGIVLGYLLYLILFN